MRPSLFILVLCACPWAASAAEPEQAADAGAPVDVAAPVDAGQAESAPEPAGSDLVQNSTELINALEELDNGLAQLVVSGTKFEQRVTEVPAVVTVITAEEIQARGLTSLADALRTVPGFYDVYDLVFHNVGIRGVSGGARANGNVLKLMIDGQTVSYRPDTGNFFGEELVPVDAIERIEVIRGPASAVYGANAFLGVVNVITRSGAGVGGARLTGSVGYERAVGGGGGALVGFGGEGYELMAAASGQNATRSGLTLPGSSPWASRLDGRGASQSDLARPKSVYAKARVGSAEAGWLRFNASVQNLDSYAEFGDYAPLSHGTRVALLNQTYRASWSRDFGPVSVTATGAYFDSGPLSSSRIRLGDPRTALLPDVHTSGYELSLEGSASLLESALQLRLGVDYSAEDHRLQSYGTLLLEDVRGADGTILRRAGTVIPGEGAGETRRFEDVGVSAQVLWKVVPSVGVIVGPRVEHHSVYGFHFSPRLGAVWAPPSGDLSVKLLFGSSFKAPSAEQLYTQPMQPRDLQGNPDLGVQTAYTGEAVGALSLWGGRAEVSLDLFVTNVLGRVEFLQKGLYLQATNALNEWYAGGELEARVKPHPSLQVRLGVGVAKLVSRDRPESATLVDAPEQPLFPVAQGHLVVDWKLPWAGLHVVPEVSVVSERDASQSNALLAGARYTLPTSVYTALALTMPDQKLLAGRPTRFALRASDLLGTATAEPGFSGIDVPARGRTILLTVTQGL